MRSEPLLAAFASASAAGVLSGSVTALAMNILNIARKKHHAMAMKISDFWQPEARLEH